jgi:diguanylate cyclase (GGDEF)-like protein
MNKLYKIVSALAYILIVIFAIAATYIILNSHSSIDVTDLEEGWVDEDGNSVDLSNLNGTQVISKDITLPEGGSSIIFKARNCYADIYINGELLVADTRSTSKIMGVSPGSKWHVVSLPISGETVKLTLNVSSCFSNSHGTVTNFYMGKVQDLYKKVTSAYIAGFVLCVFVQLLSIIIILIYIYLRNLFNAQVDLLNLGVTAYFCSQWSGCESNLWQLYVGHSEYVHFIGYLSLVAIPVCFGVFAASRLKGRAYKYACIYSVVASINALVTILLHVSGILEMHYTLFLVHILLIVFIPILVQLILSYKNRTTSARYFVYIPLLLFVICLLTAIYKYIIGSYTDYSNYIKVALVSFLLCLILFQISEIAITFSKGLKADMLHDLALSDNMTGLLNRTALTEHTAEYESIISQNLPLGIIQLDVNNLKTVNDNLGHEMGDKLIGTAANGLRESFKNNCRIYRTGGDEFLVIITNTSPQLTYETGIKALKEYCDNFNSKPNIDFNLVIAHGYVEVQEQMSLSDAIDMADVLMYQNKRELKERTKKEA